MVKKRIKRILLIPEYIQNDELNAKLEHCYEYYKRELFVHHNSIQKFNQLLEVRNESRIKFYNMYFKNMLEKISHKYEDDDIICLSEECIFLDSYHLYLQNRYLDFTNKYMLVPAIIDKLPTRSSSKFKFDGNRLLFNLVDRIRRIINGNLQEYAGNSIIFNIGTLKTLECINNPINETNLLINDIIKELQTKGHEQLENRMNGLRLDISEFEDSIRREIIQPINPSFTEVKEIDLEPVNFQPSNYVLEQIMKTKISQIQDLIVSEPVNSNLLSYRIIRYEED